jgi:cytochrome c-type biogenesis protein CcmH
LVKIAFYIAAAAMIAVALAVLLLPLMRHGRTSTRPRAVFALALIIALALPLGTASLYLMVGTPVALNTIQAQAPVSMDQALVQLRTHLTEQPDDVRGWMVLAQTNSMLHSPADARDAYDHVLKLAPNNAEAMVGWAEADSMARSDHRITGRALELLKHAVSLQPDSQRGLWLLGIGQFQQGDYGNAAATWRVLQPQLEPGSKVAEAVAMQIGVAQSRAGKSPAGASSVGAAAAEQEAGLRVQVSLAPALKKKLKPGDVLFVYARAAGGPPMPLAAVKRDAAKLPLEVTLTDAMAMTPAARLSSAAKVEVGARISHDGQPIAREGDLEGSAGIVEANRHTPVTLVIDKVHP